ncbi:low affinity immunoglobulin epsilon Fc receptor-like isoform X2 [Heterodontus francisci]|uniref:low affinity immunoglobulin epsilon Fc receptor-like isoform X2 n=1 Tax=Heterodontus francisci TaxID=7792 RepID=UPI00355B5713
MAGKGSEGFDNRNLSLTNDKSWSWIVWLLALLFGIVLIIAVIVLAICLGCKLNKIHQMSQSYSELQANHSQLDKDYKNLQAISSQLDNDYKNLQANHSQLDKDYKNLQANHSQLDKDYKNLQANHSQLDKDYKNLQANHSQLDKDYKNLQANHSQLDKDYKNLQANHSQLDKDYKNLQANHSQLDKDYKNLQANHSQLDKDYKNLQANHSQLDGEYNQLRANFSQLHLMYTQTLVGARTLLNTVIDNECNITFPHGWMASNKTCYYFSTNQTDWFNANNSCSMSHATLAIVKTQGEQDFIAEYDMKKRWIGLTDLEVVNDFRWVNGETLETEFWDTGEPNNFGQERCVTKGSRFDAQKWNNDICSTHHYWICGIPCFDYLARLFGLETVLD